MKILTDQLGAKHNFDKTLKKIVSLVPSQTELLYDLGLENSIIGITKFCVHPNHFLKEKTIIGGTKNVHYDKIKNLNPDVIIANKEENTKEIITELSKICPVWTTDIVDINDNQKMIEDFGNLFEKQTESLNLISKINDLLNQISIQNESKKIKKVAYFIWANPYMVAASGTFINDMLRLDNLENVFANQSRYPEIQLSDLSQIKDLDLIYLSSEPFPFKEKHALEIQKFAPNAKVVFVDGELYSWHGSRITKYLQSIIKS